MKKKPNSEKYIFLKSSYSLMIILFLFIFSGFAHAQQNLRAWHTQGQTFLVWEHSAMPVPETYEIYSSPQPITSIADAKWIGRIFSDNGANFRIYEYVADVRWKLPDVLGGAVIVTANEVYFAVTPHKPGTAYYAVVAYGDTIVETSNTAGPVEETTESVGVVIQHQDDKVTIYSHWIDGSAKYDSVRPDYAVMGNEYSNGIGFNFAMWHPAEGYPSGDLPLNICFHGGFDNLFLTGALPLFGSYAVPGGYFVSFDDPLPARDPACADSMFINTIWFGYNKNYNRFSPVYPADTDTVINYTMRRVWWEIDWLLANFSIDSTRVSMKGYSMGTCAVGVLTQFFPERYSAGLAYIPTETGSNHPAKYRLFGFEDQNIPTNFEGNTGIYNVLNWRWRLQNIQHKGYDWPYTILVSGKNDTIAGWSEKPEFYNDLDSAKTGFALYWDEREHINWDGAHFRYSEHISSSYLTRFRRDQSFPAFSGTDVDLTTPGRQPDPGNGDPLDGDPWGTWGGYLEWDTETIVDSADKWAVTMRVVYESIYPNDIPEADTILANVTPLRLQRFNPQPGQTYSWTLKKLSGGDTLQEGVVQADPSGTITAPDLLLIKEKTELTISGPVSGIYDKEKVNRPEKYILYQNYPNPFNPQTTIEYKIPAAGKVVLKIYNLIGQEVRTLINKEIPAGCHSVVWDGKDNLGNRVSSGVYFYKLDLNNLLDISRQIKKLLLIK